MKTWIADYASVDGNRARDLAAAKAAGCRGVIVRGAWGNVVDPTLAQDRDQASAAGIAFGAYGLLRWPTKHFGVAEPEAQAATLIGALGSLRANELPPCVDVEFGGNGRVDTILSARQAIEWVLRYRAALRARYACSMVYTSDRVWVEDLLNMAAPELADDPLWVKTAYWWQAHHAFDPDHGTPIKEFPVPWRSASAGAWLHQVQGDNVGVPGIGQADISWFIPMSRGEKSARVAWVQRRLGVAADGDFGAATAAALNLFQHDHGLNADEVVGPLTFCALCQIKV
jgi:peptidoglycan hydrolase-like protein with peptidoglycan-binding domain